MGRTEMVTARTEALNALTDTELAGAIVAYFAGNSTMPGEKDLKDRASILSAELEEGKITGFTSEVRRDMIEEFTGVLVKETKIKDNVVLNENKKNKDADGLKASDLPMVLKDAMPIPTNTMKNIYELPVSIDTEGNVLTEGGEKLGMIPAGFQKNHKGVYGMTGTVIATDYSNGKFANMSYSLIIDLGQDTNDAVNAA